MNIRVSVGKKIDRLMESGNMLEVIKYTKRFRNNKKYKDYTLIYEMIAFLKIGYFNDLALDAEEISLKCLEKDKQNIYLAIIITLFLVNQVSLAKKLMRKADDINNKAVVLINAINDYYDGEYQKSRVAINDLCFDNGDFYDNFFNATAAFYLGMMAKGAESIECFEQAKKLSPNSEIYKRACERIEIVKRT